MVPKERASSVVQKLGESVTLRAFSSTSTSRRMAKFFSEADSDEQVSVLYRFQARGERLIVGARNVDSAEDEVILDRGQRFVVTDVRLRHVRFQPLFSYRHHEIGLSPAG